MELTLNEIATLFQSSESFANAEQKINRVQIDSRLVEKNDLFVAIEGPNFDGHNFVDEVLKKGALACLVHKPSAKANVISCKNTIQGLGKIANFYRQKLKAPIVAITGSNGKTTTKELLLHVLSAHGKTQATQGNLNNHIGVPLTLLSFSRDSEFLITEMGMNAPGEITDLCKIAEPDFGLVTCVAPAHIENFAGRIENVAKAKEELFAYLNESNIAIRNHDDEWVSRFQTKAKVYDYSLKETADFTAKSLKIENGTSKFDILWQNQSYPVSLPLLGKHHVQNAVGVFAMAVALKLDPKTVAESFQNFKPTKGRGEFFKIHNWHIMDDTYNANPGSMQAAFETLNMQFPNLKKVAVLGDMKELGPDSQTWHKYVGQKAKESNIDDIYALGTDAEFYLDGFALDANKKQNYQFFEAETLAQALLKDFDPKQEMAFLFKGSRSMAVEKVIGFLKEKGGNL